MRRIALISLVACLLATALPLASAGAAVPAGENGLIAFTRRPLEANGELGDSDIVLVNADGSGEQTLDLGEAEGDPTWSPDGRFIAFSRDGAIWAQERATGEETQLTAGPVDADPAWSPDGNRLAFTRFQSPNPDCDHLRDYDVYVLDLESGEEVLHIQAPCAADGQPDWSPDSSRLTFHTGVFDANFNGRYDIVTVDAATGEDRVSLSADFTISTNPSWSPDGSTIVFDTSSGLWAVPAAGGEATQLTEAVDCDDSEAVWSPDGTQIVFRSCREDDPNEEGLDYDLYIINADGSGLRQLTQGTVYDEDPTWGPVAGAAPEPEPEPEPEPSPGPGGDAGFDGDPATTERTTGADPAAVAIGISQTRFADAGGTDPRAAAHVVLSRDDAFPDSLAGSPLTADGPLLVTATGALTAATRAEIQRVLPQGGTVYLLGGVAAISQAVEDELTALGYQPERLFGPSRIETAVAVATEVRRLFPNATEVAVARAFPNDTAGWADSVTGGGWAASEGVPILVTGTDELAPQAATWLQADGPSRTVLLGGLAALSQAVEDAVPAPFRVAGAERTETAARISTQLWGVEASGPRTYVVTNLFDPSGWVYGLSAGGLAADAGAPLLGVGEDVPAATAELIASCGSPQIETLVVGGAGVISDTVVAELDRLDGNNC